MNVLKKSALFYRFTSVMTNNRSTLLAYCTLVVEPWLISNLMHKIIIYLHIIHLLKSSTCFEHYSAHLQEVNVVIVVTGISGSKAMICIGNSGSNPERALCR